MPKPPMRTRLPFLRWLVMRSMNSCSRASDCFLAMSCFSAISVARCFSVTVGAVGLVVVVMNCTPPLSSDIVFIASYQQIARSLEFPGLNRIAPGDDSRPADVRRESAVEPTRARAFVNNEGKAAIRDLTVAGRGNRG